MLRKVLSLPRSVAQSTLVANLSTIAYKQEIFAIKKDIKAFVSHDVKVWKNRAKLQSWQTDYITELKWERLPSAVITPAVVNHYLRHHGQIASLNTAVTPSLILFSRAEQGYTILLSFNMSQEEGGAGNEVEYDAEQDIVDSKTPHSFNISIQSLSYTAGSTGIVFGCYCDESQAFNIESISYFNPFTTAGTATTAATAATKAAGNAADTATTAKPAMVTETNDVMYWDDLSEEVQKSLSSFVTLLGVDDRLSLFVQQYAIKERAKRHTEGLEGLTRFFNNFTWDESRVK